MKRTHPLLKELHSLKNTEPDLVSHYDRIREKHPTDTNKYYREALQLQLERQKKTLPLPANVTNTQIPKDFKQEMSIVYINPLSLYTQEGKSTLTVHSDCGITVLSTGQIDKLYFNDVNSLLFQLESCPTFKLGILAKLSIASTQNLPFVRFKFYWSTNNEDAKIELYMAMTDSLKRSIRNTIAVFVAERRERSLLTPHQLFIRNRLMELTKTQPTDMAIGRHNASVRSGSTRPPNSRPVFSLKCVINKLPRRF